MFKKLRNRILLINLSTLILVLSAAFAAVYLITSANVRNENRRRLDARPQLSGRGMTISRDEAGMIEPDYVVAIAGSAELSSSFDIIVDVNGRILSVMSYIDLGTETYGEAARRVLEQESSEGRLSFKERDWIYKKTAITTTLLFPLPFGIIHGESVPGYQISYLDVTESNRTLSRMLMTLLLAGAGVFLLLFAVSLTFANRAVRPVEESFARQKQFITDASHELRTPLTVIDANLDAISTNEAESVSSQKKWMDYIKTETSRMNHLISELLLLSKSEDIDPAPVEREYIDFSKLTGEAVLAMEAVAYEHGAAFSCRIDPGITVKGHRDGLQQVLRILLDNAIKYTEGDGAIEVSLGRHRSRAVLRVKNSSGISENALERVFDRFYRADVSRGSATGGYGLGLSIARTIVAGCGGEIYAKRLDGPAVEFTVILK